MVQLPFMKKKEEAIRGKGFSPTDRVREMASRGFTEPEMIEVLRREGFSPGEIDSALIQALKIGVSSTPSPNPQPSSPPPEPRPSQQDSGLPTLEDILPTLTEKKPEIPETSLPQEYHSQSYPSEEYIDYIVQTRIGEVNEKMNEFSIRYQELDKKVNLLQQHLMELSKTRGGEQREIINKIDGFAESINDTNSRLGGMERAFKETLPALIESVRALSDLVSRMKREA